MLLRRYETEGSGRVKAGTTAILWGGALDLSECGKELTVSSNALTIVLHGC